MIEDKTNSSRDWEDFWHSPEKTGSWSIGTTSPQETLDVARCVTYEEYQEAKSIVKAYERQANMREQAYYDARAKIDAEYEKQKKELEEIRKQGGFEWTPESKHSNYYFDTDRNR